MRVSIVIFKYLMSDDAQSCYLSVKVHRVARCFDKTTFVTDITARDTQRLYPSSPLPIQVRGGGDVSLYNSKFYNFVSSFMWSLVDVLSFPSITQLYKRIFTINPPQSKLYRRVDNFRGLAVFCREFRIFITHSHLRPLDQKIMNGNCE